MTDHPLSLDVIVPRLRAYDPDTDEPDDAWTAATALVLADVGRPDPDILFIERVKRRGDRWSGQMALPGGKVEEGDNDVFDTAVRETHEEVGVQLPPALGRLDDLRRPGPSTGRVATTVHLVAGRPDTTPEPGEVESVVWIGLAHLFEKDNHHRYFHGPLGPFAGIKYAEHSVWGLTLGTLRNLADVIGHELPRPRGPLLG